MKINSKQGRKEEAISKLINPRRNPEKYTFFKST
jgi:hypothetical protein